MPQCTNYPKGCNGLVKLDEKDKKWYCQKHFYNYGRMKGLGLKESKTANLIRKRKIPPIPPTPPRGPPT